jgi:hypothetical protein
MVIDTGEYTKALCMDCFEFVLFGYVGPDPLEDV